jgi:hypothetical protein
VTASLAQTGRFHAYFSSGYIQARASGTGVQASVVEETKVRCRYFRARALCPLRNGTGQDVIIGLFGVRGRQEQREATSAETEWVVVQQPPARASERECARMKDRYNDDDEGMYQKALCAVFRLGGGVHTGMVETDESRRRQGGNMVQKES